MFELSPVRLQLLIGTSLLSGNFYYVHSVTSVIGEKHRQRRKRLIRHDETY